MFIFYKMMNFSFSDPTTKAPSTRNAFHPQPCQHRVYLPDRAGGVCQQDPKPGHSAHQHACTIHLLPVPNRLYPHLEVG